MEAFEVSYVGGMHIEKNLNEMLIEDNLDIIDKLPTIKSSSSIPGTVIEDIKAKMLIVMQR